MGRMVDGVWQTAEKIAASDGRFRRAETSFRNWITPDGAPGPSGEGGFAAEPGRYHLYVAWACPWAHRTLIFRTLKKLAPLIGVSFVETVLGDEGWTFSERRPDDLGGREHLYEVYPLRGPTTPAGLPFPFFGTRSATRSSRTNRPRSSACSIRPSTASAAMRPATTIRSRSAPRSTGSTMLIYATVNDGVYRCGFARTQERL